MIRKIFKWIFKEELILLKGEIRRTEDARRNYAEQENECLWCDKRCEKDFCSKQCAKNWIND